MSLESITTDLEKAGYETTFRRDWIAARDAAFSWNHDSIFSGDCTVDVYRRDRWDTSSLLWLCIAIYGPPGTDTVYMMPPEGETETD